MSRGHGRHDVVRSVEVVEVIRVEFVRGLGLEATDPIRGVTQFWDKGGTLLAEVDPHKEQA